MYVTCADLEGGVEFAKFNIADITGHEKNCYFSYLCTSTVTRQTESILLKVGPPPMKNFLDPRLCYERNHSGTKIKTRYLHVLYVYL